MKESKLYNLENNKKGISMIILIITIVIIIILMATISLRISIASGRERLSTLVNNIQVIEEYINSCKIMNEDLPKYDENTTYTLDDLKNIVSSSKLYDFESDIAANGESNESTFWRVDIKKMGIKKEFTGLKKDGDESDIYVYSETTGTVYYLHGIRYDGRYHFTINDSITNIV